MTPFLMLVLGGFATFISVLGFQWVRYWTGEPKRASKPKA